MGQVDVSSFFFNTRPIAYSEIFSELRKLNSSSSSPELSELKIADLTLSMIEKYGGNIDYQIFLRKLTDMLNMRTTIYFSFLIWIYVIFFCIPFLLQMSYVEEEGAATLLLSCNIISIFFFILEIPQVLDLGLKGYFTIPNNYNDIAIFVTFTIYYSIRMGDLKNSLPGTVPIVDQLSDNPDARERTYEQQITLTFFNLILLV